MNRIDKIFTDKNKKIFSIYFTAGHPSLNDTATIIETLADSGVDMIEIGMPFSDPLADGPVIQESSKKALNNGMSIKVLFEQLKAIRTKVDIPLLLMGYFNPVYKYGIEAFCKKCAEVGIDGLIIPDLPMDEYENKYKKLFLSNGLYNIFLVTPQTTDERLKKIDEVSNGFIYLVSSFSTTGSGKGIEGSKTYFERMKAKNLKNPTVVGFGIKDTATFNFATTYANGAIIGTAFVKSLEASGNLQEGIKKFVGNIR